MTRSGPFLLLLGALVFNAVANVLIKYSAVHPRPASSGTAVLGRAHFVLHPAFLIGLAFFAINVFAYQGALRALKISVAYPIMVGGGFLLIMLASWLIFHERLGVSQCVGIGLIFAGIWIVVH